MKPSLFVGKSPSSEVGASDIGRNGTHTCTKPNRADGQIQVRRCSSKVHLGNSEVCPKAERAANP
jgi:hypothetical protein